MGIRKDRGSKRGGDSTPTCLSLMPSKRTSSMMVSFGIFPPVLASSSSCWRSLGSYATLLPPANAEPACEAGVDAEAWPFESDERSFEEEIDGFTLRRERPEELIAWALCSTTRTVGTRRALALGMTARQRDTRLAVDARPRRAHSVPVPCPRVRFPPAFLVYSSSSSATTTTTYVCLPFCTFGDIVRSN